ncbi:hypothetical protein [Acidimicrobium ferrooxidans]|nr:hypothetical protein [Acidimicrobium ferrooxidans]
MAIAAKSILGLLEALGCARGALDELGAAAKRACLPGDGVPTKTQL